MESMGHCLINTHNVCRTDGNQLLGSCQILRFNVVGAEFISHDLAFAVSLETDKGVGKLGLAGLVQYGFNAWPERRVFKNGYLRLDGHFVDHLLRSCHRMYGNA